MKRASWARGSWCSSRRRANSSSAIFLVAANTRVISVMLFDLWEEGNFETLAALGCVLLAATILIVVGSYRMLGRDLLLKA